MKAIGRLEHPNIVRAYDVREIDGSPVLVMEYVEGMDLSRLLHCCGHIRMADSCELIGRRQLRRNTHTNTASCIVMSSRAI